MTAPSPERQDGGEAVASLVEILTDAADVMLTTYDIGDREMTDAPSPQRQDGGETAQEICPQCGRYVGRLGPSYRFRGRVYHDGCNDYLRTDGENTTLHARISALEAEREKYRAVVEAAKHVDRAVQRSGDPTHWFESLSEMNNALCEAGLIAREALGDE